jgi:hypothetical protein
MYAQAISFETFQRKKFVQELISDPAHKKKNGKEKE